MNNENVSNAAVMNKLFRDHLNHGGCASKNPNQILNPLSFWNSDSSVFIKHIVNAQHSHISHGAVLFDPENNHVKEEGRDMK